MASGPGRLHNAHFFCLGQYLWPEILPGFCTPSCLTHSVLFPPSCPRPSFTQSGSSCRGPGPRGTSRQQHVTGSDSGQQRLGPTTATASSGGLSASGGTVLEASGQSEGLLLPQKLFPSRASFDHSGSTLSSECPSEGRVSLDSGSKFQKFCLIQSIPKQGCSERISGTRLGTDMLHGSEVLPIGCIPLTGAHSE